MACKSLLGFFLSISQTLAPTISGINTLGDIAVFPSLLYSVSLFRLLSLLTVVGENGISVSNVIFSCLSSWVTANDVCLPSLVICQ